ncbi:hypothetical protein KBA63_02630 [Candidatus Woesebacteria bacterium]|nr:hypothetical protein [Candidatus Woesebacteria bacterium]MBP9687179.1 hypothetical protein [Candidatus Woesebacteria bacterium]
MVEFDTVMSGSAALVLEVAMAIQNGKLAPFGYEVVADFFRNEEGRTTPAHNFLLAVEAVRAGKFPSMVSEFPDAQRLGDWIISVMYSQYPDIMSRAKSRISATTWTVDAALADQTRAGEQLLAILEELSKL